MKRSYPILLIVVLLLLVSAVTAFAHEEAPPPMYGCQDNFELHPLHHHDGDGDMDHHHVGLDMSVVDMNGDGWFCMKPVGVDGYNHVHIDNLFPLQ